MFGYRLVREADYHRTIETLEGLQEAVEQLRHEQLRDEMDRRLEMAALLERLIDKSSKADANKMLADVMVANVNELQRTVGALKTQITGKPVEVPIVRVQSGAPLMAEADEAHDIFEDVGDVRAAELATRGELAEDTVDHYPFPSAADLTADTVPV